tara:strand:+ start:248 stop:643 length:396 start_codon:yes stop_codon:yes gene_type:complete
LKYEEGETFSKKFLITEHKVESFALITGDVNPIHLDQEYAKSTVFKKRISHGMLVASCISNVIANDLPGPGSIYLSQNLNFKKPVFLGDMVNVVVEITKIKEEKKIMFLKTQCLDDEEDIVIDGEAVVKFN